MKYRHSLPQIGCSRRSFVQGLAAATAAAILVGCQSGSSLPTATSTTCSGTSACIDLADPTNAALMTIGGAMLIDTARDTIIVIRSSETVVIALSAICTHAGCALDFAAPQLTCPCHGSVFDEHGNVVTGPARSSLKVYSASLAGTTITVVT